MRTRILWPDEWPRINVPELPPLFPYVAPQNIAVIVAEDEAGEIIGVLSALRVTHLEGIWVKPGLRGGGVAHALFQQALDVARTRDETWVLGGAADADEAMDGYIRRLGGFPLPVRFYPMPVGGH